MIRPPLVLMCLLGAAITGHAFSQQAQLEFRHRSSSSMGSGYLAISPDGRWLAAGNPGKLVRLWDLTGQAPFRALQPTSVTVLTVAFSHDGRRLFVAGNASSIQVWNPESAKLEEEIPLGGENRVYHLAASRDGRWLAAHSWHDRSRIMLWNLADKSNAVIATGNRPDDGGDAIGGLLFSPDSRLLAAAHRKGRVRLWDPESRQETRTLRLARGFSLAFTADGRWLAAGDQTISLWDTSTWKQAASWDARSAGSTLPYNRKFAFSPDGTLLAGASYGKTLRLWKLPGGAVVAENEIRQRSQLSEVAFAPGGRWFATVDSDGIVGLWEAASGRHLASLAMLGGDSEEWAVASVDGHYDGSAAGVEQILGWRWGEEKFPATHFPDRQVAGLLQRIASGQHTPRSDDQLAAASRTQAEALALFKAEGAARTAERIALNRAHPFGGLAETLAKPPLHGGTTFSADALQKIFAASGCEGSHVLQARFDSTEVLHCIDKNAAQRAVLNVIRPNGPHPLIYVNASRRLYSPETGFAVTRASPLALMLGGTVIDTDLGTYRVVRIGGVLTQALGASGQLVALRGKARQYLVIEYTNEGERVRRGLSQSRKGAIVRFNIQERGLAYYVEDLQRLEPADTVSLPGEKGEWWSAEIATPLGASGTLGIVPTRVRSGGNEILARELLLQKTEHDTAALLPR